MLSRIERGSEETDDRHRPLLRTHRSGPRDRTTDKRNELPPPHSITSSTMTDQIISSRAPR
jgi:hypothetical protein